MSTTAPEHHVIADIRGRVGCITLNRPKALNALSLGMIRDVTAALLAWRDDPQVLALTRVHKRSATQTLDFSDFKCRVYEKVRQEALVLRGEGDERLQSLLDKELKRLARRERKRLLRAQRKALQARIRGAGLLDFRELSLIAEQFGRMNCLAAYLRVLLKYLSVWR